MVPLLSEALALMVMFAPSLNWAPSTGEVIETTGEVLPPGASTVMATGVEVVDALSLSVALAVRL